VVRVMGSDTLGASVLPEIARAFEAEHPRVDVHLEALGSSTAFVGLFDGSADLGASSRAMRADEIEEAERLGLTLHPVRTGWAGVALAVPRGGPLPSLEVSPLRAIYTGRAPAALGAFHVITRPAESGTYAYFAERVLGGDDVVASAITIEHN